MQQMNKFLIVIDGSYFSYTALFGATKEFTEKHPDEAILWIKPIDECDQNNLPNLLNCDTYKKILKKFVMRRLESIDNIAKENFQDVIDVCDQVDVIFAIDDSLEHSFRKALYPEYKSQRKAVKRQYQLSPIKEYITNVIFKEIDIENCYGYHLVKVEGAEGDDVIATSLIRLKDNYAGTLLIASDHDFLQIDNVREFDLFGSEAKRKLGDEEVSAKDYLIGKILMGDRSDNIKQVFTRCGPKTALNWTKNKEALKKTLVEDNSSAQRYLLNKKLISFADIPKDLSDKIYEKLNESLYSEEVINKRKMANSWPRWD